MRGCTVLRPDARWGWMGDSIVRGGGAQDEGGEGGTLRGTKAAAWRAASGGVGRDEDGEGGTRAAALGGTRTAARLKM